MKLRCVIFLIAIPTLLLGQEKVHPGKVIDKASGETLPFATIQIKGTTQGTTANGDGFFTLFTDQETLTLVVHFVGYRSQEIEIDGGEMTVVELEQQDQLLEEIIVEAMALDNPVINVNENISQVAMSPEAIKTLPSIGEQDIFRALQLLPGVSGTNEASSGLYVRGGTPDQNLILLDGFTVYHVDHFYGFFSAFNPNAIKDVQLYKGGFEAKYGGRLSSVMELTGKTGNSNKLSFGAGMGAISANAYIEIPIGNKLNIFLAGRRSYTDVIESGVYNDIFDLYNDQSNSTVQTSNVPQGGRNGGGRGVQENATEPSFFFYDLNGKLSFRPTNKDVISLSFYNGKDDLDNSRMTENAFENRNGETITLRNNVADLLQWGNVGSSIRWARQWNPNYYSNLVLGYSNYFSDRDRLSNIEIERSDTLVNRVVGSVETNDLYDYSLSFKNEYKLNSSHTLGFGVQATYNDIGYNFQLNDTINLIDESNTGLLNSFYLQDTWTINDRITITGGLRSNYYDVTEKSYFEPRASGSLKLTNRLRLKAAWGHYYQFVNRIIREDVTQGSRDFWLLADDVNSPVSFAKHYIAGASYETDNWLLDLEVFEKDLDGISEFSLRFQGARATDGQESFFFEGTGIARGLELLFQKKVGFYKGWLSYTLSEVVYDLPGISDFPYYALHDSRHEINLVQTYEWKKWVLGATWVYGTGKPYTAPYGEYEITTLDGTSYEYISVGAKNAFRLPDYHRLDLSVNYNFKLGSGKGTLGLSVFNVYNQENIWYKEFLVEEEEVIETDVQLIGFTPNLNLSIKF